MTEHWEIYVDGASSGTGGQQPAAAAYWVRLNKIAIASGGMYISGTNNFAEVTAILLGIKHFVEEAPADATLTLCSDSEWAVFTIAKKLQLMYLKHYNTEHYPDLYAEIEQLWDDKRMTFKVIPREFNSKADALAKAIKKRGY